MIIEGVYTFAGHARWNLGWPTPNYAASFLAMLLPWTWGLEILVGSSAAARLRRFFGATGAILEAILWFALGYTYSRGGAVAVVLAGTCFVVGVRRLPSRRALAMAVALRGSFALAVVAATGFYTRLNPAFAAEDGAVVNRLELWRGGLKMITAAPASGWGSGESGRAFMNWFQAIGREDRYTTMVNSYLHVAVEHGLPLLGLVMAGLWIVVREPGGLSASSGRQNRPAWPLCSAARASLIAWAAANLFTTLWTDPWLWVVPAISATVSIQSLAGISRSGLRLHVMAACGSGALVACATYGAGLWLSRDDSLAPFPGPQGVVTVVRRGAAASLRGGLGQIWEAWPDRAVLGPAPGQELRLWLEATPAVGRLVVHPVSDPPGRGIRAHGILLFGRQVERLGELEVSGAKAEEIRIIHPLKYSQGPIPASFGDSRGIVVIPEIDQFGQNAFWRAWADSARAQVLQSPGVGIDVRAAWPNDSGRSARGVPPAATLSLNREESPSSSASEDEVAPIEFSVLWGQLQSKFRSIALNGIWRQSYPLGANRATRLLDLRCRLDHRVDMDLHGGARSLWVVAALRTWLVPDGRSRLLWQPPGGPPVEFELSAIGDDFSPEHPLSWRIRRTGPATYELRAPGGALWTYDRGILTGIDHPLLGRLSVRTRGGLVLEIRSADSRDPAPSILTADFDAEGNPTRLALAGAPPVSFTQAGGRLVAVTRPGTFRLRFSYANGLVSDVEEAEMPTTHLTWAENLGFARGDSRWIEPVHLASDDDYDYRYELTSGGYLIRVTSRETQETEVMLYNPLRHQLCQRDPDGTTYVVTFRPNAVGQTPERIERAKGALEPL